MEKVFGKVALPVNRWGWFWVTLILFSSSDVLVRDLYCVCMFVVRVTVFCHEFFLWSMAGGVIRLSGGRLVNL